MSLSVSQTHPRGSSTDISDAVKQIVGRVGKKWTKSGGGSIPQALEEQAYLVQLMLETAHDTGAVELCQTILENFRRTLRTYSAQMANLEQAKTAIPDMVDGVKALQEKFMVVHTKHRTLEIEVKYLEAKIDLLQRRNRVFDEFGERLAALYSTSWPRRNSGIMKPQHDAIERNIDELYRELHTAQMALERYRLVHVLLSRGLKALESAERFMRQFQSTRDMNALDAMRMFTIQTDVVMKQAKFVLPSLFRDQLNVEIFQDGWLSMVFQSEQNGAASDMINFFSKQQAIVSPFIDQANSLIESQSQTEQQLREGYHAAILVKENSQRKLLYGEKENMEGIKETLDLSLDVLSELDEVNVNLRINRGFVVVSPSEESSLNLNTLLSSAGAMMPGSDCVTQAQGDRHEPVSDPPPNSVTTPPPPLPPPPPPPLHSNSLPLPLSSSPSPSPVTSMDRLVKGRSSPLPPPRPRHEEDEEDPYGGMAPSTTKDTNPRHRNNLSQSSPSAPVPVSYSSQGLQTDPRLNLDRRPSPSPAKSSSSSNSTLPLQSRQMLRALPAPPSTSPSPSPVPTPIPSSSPSTTQAIPSPRAPAPAGQAQLPSSTSSVRQSTRTPSPLPPLPTVLVPPQIATSIPASRPNPQPKLPAVPSNSTASSSSTSSSNPSSRDNSYYTDMPPSSQALPPPPPYTTQLPLTASPLSTQTPSNQTFQGILKQNQTFHPPTASTAAATSARPISMRKPSMDQWGTTKVAAATPHKTKLRAMFDKFRGGESQHHPDRRHGSTPESPIGTASQSSGVSPQEVVAAFLAAPTAAAVPRVATPASAPPKLAHPKPRFVDEVEIIPRPESDSYPYSDDEDELFEHPPSPSKSNSFAWSNGPDGGEENEEDEELLADYYSVSPNQSQVHDKAREYGLAKAKFPAPPPSSWTSSAGIPTTRTAYVPPSDKASPLSQAPPPQAPSSQAPRHIPPSSSSMASQQPTTLFQPKPHPAANIPNSILSSNWQPQMQQPSQQPQSSSIVPSRGSAFS